MTNPDSIKYYLFLFLPAIFIIIRNIIDYFQRNIPDLEVERFAKRNNYEYLTQLPLKEIFPVRFYSEVFKTFFIVPKGRNILSRDNLAFFEYNTKIPYTVVVIKLNSNVPNLILKVNLFFKNTYNYPKYKNIDFKDFTKFSSDYELFGEDENAVKNFFNNSRRELFLNLKVPGNLEVKDGYLLYYQNQISLSDYINFMYFVDKLVKILEK